MPVCDTGGYWENLFAPVKSCEAARQQARRKSTVEIGAIPILDSTAPRLARFLPDQLGAGANFHKGDKMKLTTTTEKVQALRQMIVEQVSYNAGQLFFAALDQILTPEQEAAPQDTAEAKAD